MWRVIAGSLLVHAGVVLALRTLPEAMTRKATARVPLEVHVTVEATPAPADSQAMPTAQPSVAAVRRTNAGGAAGRAEHTSPDPIVARPSGKGLAMRVSPVVPAPADVATSVPLPERAPEPAASLSLIPEPPPVDSASHPRPAIELPCPSCVARKLLSDVHEWAKDPYEYTRKMGKQLDESTGADDIVGLPTLEVGPPLAGSGPPPSRTSYTIFVTLFRAHADFDGSTAGPRQRALALDESREARAAAAGRGRARALVAGLNALPGRLGAIWARADQPAPVRRRWLFALWDECAENGDPEVVHAGTAARAAIVAFVREHLPRGGPDAYPDDELDELNRGRASASEFQPYGPAP